MADPRDQRRVRGLRGGGAGERGGEREREGRARDAEQGRGAG